MALSTEWVALKTGQVGFGGVEYSKSCLQQIAFNKTLRNKSNEGSYNIYIP